MADKIYKILLVEDDIMLSDMYATTFKAEGYNVLVAKTGEEGLEIAIKEIPDVVLLDIMLPGELDGLKVLKMLKKDEKTSLVPVMIMTNLEDDKTISEGLKLGANGYFFKSQSSPSDIVRNLKTLIM